MKKLNEYVEKLRGIIADATNVNTFVKRYYDDEYQMKVPYVCHGEVDYHGALEDMLDGRTNFELSSLDQDEIRIIQAGNNAMFRHYEDYQLAIYILDIVEEYLTVLPLGKPDELWMVKQDTEDQLVLWFEEAVDAMVDEAYEMVGERCEDPLLLWSEDALLGELRRRGHYEVECVFPNLLDMDPGIRDWAYDNDKVDDLMDEWIEAYSEAIDWSDLKSETLGEAAAKLGYEPTDEIIDCMNQHVTTFDGAVEMIIDAIGDDADNYDTEELVEVLFDITPDDYVLKDNYVLRDRYMYKDEFLAVIKDYMI